MPRTLTSHDRFRIHTAEHRRLLQLLADAPNAIMGPEDVERVEFCVRSICAYLDLDPAPHVARVRTVVERSAA